MLGLFVESLDLFVESLRVLVAVPLQFLLLCEQFRPLLEKDGLTLLMLCNFFFSCLEAVGEDLDLLLEPQLLSFDGLTHLDEAGFIFTDKLCLLPELLLGISVLLGKGLDDGVLLLELLFTLHEHLFELLGSLRCNLSQLRLFLLDHQIDLR